MDAYQPFFLRNEMLNCKDEDMDDLREMYGVDKKVPEKKVIKDDDLLVELDELVKNKDGEW
jgi:hypothetical protein